MKNRSIPRLHWKLYFPIVGILWLIIGVTIIYFVSHEKQRQKENLENRLLNVNNTVIDAYERGVDLQKTVDFIKLFTDHTTLDPLRITVYDDSGVMVADNEAPTIYLRDEDGNIRSELAHMWDTSGNATIQDMKYGDHKQMISSRSSSDGSVHSFAALPYEGEVVDFLSIDPMVWVMVILLGIVSSVMAFFGVRAVSRNVYALRDFAAAIASDNVPENTEDRRFSNDELGDVSRNLVALYRDKLHAEQEKMHYERQIGINVSHELNTPVSIIKGYIDTVLDDSDMPEEQRRIFLTRAQQNTVRLASLVNDVGMVMRLGANTGTLEGTVVNFHQLAARITEDTMLGHIADGMTITCDIPADCRVVAHESLLTNALYNLIYNSAEHSSGTTMTLRWLREENGMHVFTFSDDGIGVDPEHLGRLFDMFYRVDWGRSRKNGGSGLGLPLVRRIITAIGGTISVDNLPDGGLVFTFTLPAAG